MTRFFGFIAEWWRRRMHMRSELRSLREAIQHDLETAGFSRGSAARIAKERISGTRPRTGLRAKLHDQGSQLMDVLLPSLMRGRIEPWIRPAAMLALAALLIVSVPGRERVRAGLLTSFPHANSDRLAVFTIYLNMMGGPFLPAVEVVRGMDLFEQSAPFREVPVARPDGNVIALETTSELDAVLKPLPRSLVFPLAELTYPWSDPDIQRIMVLARMKPGLTLTQARTELRNRKEFRWVVAESLASRSLYKPFFPALFWAIPILLLTWRLGEDLVKDRRMALYRLYSLFTIGCYAVLFAVVWVVGMETGTSLFPVGSTSITLFFIGFPITWLLAAALTLLRAAEDLQNRCRTCMKRLRLPMEEGEWGALLVRPQIVQSMCPWGHGQLVVDRLDVHWTFAGNFWEELAASARK